MDLNRLNIGHQSFRKSEKSTHLNKINAYVTTLQLKCIIINESTNSRPRDTFKWELLLL